MSSPAEMTIQKAEKQIAAHDAVDTAFEKRKQLIGNINLAMDALGRKGSASLEDYADSGDHTLGITVQRHDDYDGYTRTITQLDITGHLASRQSGNAAEVPAYRVTRIDPRTDGGHLKPHYEISAADPSAEGGFKPMALVEQDNGYTHGSARVSYDMFKVHDKLDGPEMKELEETGLFVDSRAGDVFKEVQDILGQVAVSHQAEAPADEKHAQELASR